MLALLGGSQDKLEDLRIFNKTKFVEVTFGWRTQVGALKLGLVGAHVRTTWGSQDKLEDLRIFNKIKFF